MLAHQMLVAISLRTTDWNHPVRFRTLSTPYEYGSRPRDPIPMLRPFGRERSVPSLLLSPLLRSILDLVLYLSFLTYSFQ